MCYLSPAGFCNAFLCPTHARWMKETKKRVIIRWDTFGRRRIKEKNRAVSRGHTMKTNKIEFNVREWRILSVFARRARPYQRYWKLWRNNNKVIFMGCSDGRVVFASARRPSGLESTLNATGCSTWEKIKNPTSTKQPARPLSATCARALRGHLLLLWAQRCVGIIITTGWRWSLNRRLSNDCVSFDNLSSHATGRRPLDDCVHLQCGVS